MNTEIILGVSMFTVIIMMLVFIILFARNQLVSTGAVTIEINDDPAKAITTNAGGKLLQTLSDSGIFLSSACGGGGTCGQCRCRVLEGVDRCCRPRPFILPAKSLMKAGA